MGDGTANQRLALCRRRGGGQQGFEAALCLALTAEVMQRVATRRAGNDDDLIAGARRDATETPQLPVAVRHNK